MKKLNYASLFTLCFMLSLFTDPISSAQSAKTEIHASEKTIPAKNGKPASVSTSFQAKSTEISGAAAAGSKEKLASGKIEFFSVGKPSMLKIHGTSTDLTGELSRSGKSLSGDLQVPLESFNSGMSTRDNHMKEKVFEVSKYKTAELKLTELNLPAETGDFKDLPFSGKLNLHGVEKDVKGLVNVTAQADSTRFTAHFEIKLTDYQITPPEFMGMSIQDEVKIDVQGEAKTK